MLGCHRPVRHRRHGRGIEPAGEQAAERNVADDLSPHDVVQQLGDGLDRTRQIVLVPARRELPVAPLGQALRFTRTI